MEWLDELENRATISLKEGKYTDFYNGHTVSTWIYLDEVIRCINTIRELEQQNEKLRSLTDFYEVQETLDEQHS